MSKQTILWTVLPNGRITEGRHAGSLRVSVVVSPRLTPQNANEQALAAFPEFLDWPATLDSLRLRLRVGSRRFGLVPLEKPDSGLWQQLLPGSTPVAGFQYRNMSAVNLRSFPVRNVLGFVRRQYARLATQSASDHPRLLPWKQAHPALQGMLADLGTRTQVVDYGKRQVEVALPGFSRFFDRGNRKAPDAFLDRAVFGPKSRYRGKVGEAQTRGSRLPRGTGKFPLRALPPDWQDPGLGGPDAAIMGQFTTADEYSFYQADRFYRRTVPSDAQRRMRRPSYDAIPAAPAEPVYDFHRIVASYADYPSLLRRLGLVIDCAVRNSDRLEDLITQQGGELVGTLWLELTPLTAHHDTGGDALPRTAFHVDKERFVTRPRTDDHERGLLRLDGADDGWGQAPPKEQRSPFDVYQVDPDGAALKTVGFTLTAQNLVSRSLSPRQPDGEITYTTGDDQAVAGMRSGGIGISRHGRALRVAEDAAAADLKNQLIEGGSGSDIVLFAEDLLRGYRVDVGPVADSLTPPDRWHSLCAREGEYRLIDNGATLDLPPDEGYTKGPSTSQSPDPSANPDDHYLHESLFRWTGWSLCAPRPGLTLRAQEAEDGHLQGEDATTVTDTAAQGNGIAAEFRAARGSLPRLRFGQQYRLRARMVDLAGNSLEVDDPTLGDLEHATEAVGYWRFEPVDPPVVVHRHRVSEGESLERMVIRSNHDVTAEQYPSSPAFAAAIQLPDAADFEYPVTNERHLVPPKASQQQCEQHGLFDPFFSTPQRIKQGYAIAAREAGTLYDPTADAQVELVTPKKLQGVATTTTLPPALPSTDNPVGDRLQGGQYVIHREAIVKPPYLADGAAGGIALFALPGHELPGVDSEIVLGPSCVVVRAPDQSLVLLISHAGEWPDLVGARILLRERAAKYTDLPCERSDKGSGLPVWHEKDRTLTLFLAKGQITRLAYSSFVHRQMLPGFGLPQWAENQAGRQFIADMAQLGRHWMLSPYRKLTLVHATQQPVCLPELVKLSVTRPPGAQHADLRCRLVRLHGPSTGKFEITAEWDEWVDDLQKPGPERVAGRGELGEIALAENHDNAFVLQTAVNAQQVDPGRPRARADRHQLGDTRFRLVRYRVRATTRFREYLPPSLYAQTDLVTQLGPIALGESVMTGAPDDPGAPVLPNPAGSDANTRLLATAPPDDPRVLYVVPTLRWQYTVDEPKARDVTRLGNGLRVWLDRPWFSSGDGELLGVVILGNNALFTEIPSHLVPLVTQWGLDPLWETLAPKNRTRVSDFTARVHDAAVPLQERPDDPPVHIVGHRVHWDASRGLWYSDIELDPGDSYMPFVRLALVRFQPNALNTARVSKVVLAEFAQVLPRRRASFTRAAGQPAKVLVALRGTVPHAGPMKFPVDSEYQDVSIVGGPHETGRNRVELVLQTRDPQIDSDLAWQDASTLASSIAEPASGGLFAEPFPGLDSGRVGVVQVSDAQKDRRVLTRSGTSVRLEPNVTLAPGVRANVSIADRLPDVLINRDPTIWQAEITLPDTGPVPRRLMLREFERFYTDRTVPESRGRSVNRRRVIEERLVYSTIFDLKG